MNQLRIRVDARSAVLDVLPRGAVGAEVGVAKGDYSKRLIRSLKPQKIFLIDPWRVADAGVQRRAAHYGADRVDQSFLDSRYQYVCRRFEKEREAGVVEIVRGGFQDWLDREPTQELDWVYIDGDHSHDGVLRDLRIAMAVVKYGGLIACDDYGTHGWWEGGVTSAIHGFLDKEDVVAEFVLGSQFVMRKVARTPP